MALLLLTFGAMAHVWMLGVGSPLELSGDEAHYWEWSRRPALSYYSKGPLVAYIIAISRVFLATWSESIVGTELLAVRIPAVMLSMLTAVGLFKLTLDVLGRSKLALAAVALTFTMPIFVAGSMLMTIDAPFVCAWTWTLVLLLRAVRRDERSSWLAAGVLIALGILAKYTMVLIFPAFGLYLLTEPAARRFLRRPGPYVAMAVGFLGFVPPVIWNAQHDWVSFRHVAGQAGLADGPGFSPQGVLVYVGGQAGVVNALWLVGMIWGLVDIWRKPVDPQAEGHEPRAIRLMCWAAAVPWVVFLLFSPVTKVQPNWPVVALIGNLVILVLWLTRRLRLPTLGERRLARAFVAVGIVLGALMGGIMHRSELLYPVFARLAADAPPWDLTPIAKYDPTARLRGWSQLGREVGQVLRNELKAGRDPIILTDDYQTASQIAFYCPGEPVTYSLTSVLGGRRSQYDVWENPIRDAETFVGRPCIYVGSLHPELTGKGSAPALLAEMSRIRTVRHEVAGQPVRIWAVYTSPAFLGFSGGEAASEKY